MYDVYACGRHDRWRFALGKSGERPLVAIGLNPNTATRDKGDVTATKVERVAARAGFDGFVLVNLYPVRAARCAALPLRENRDAYATNLAQIAECIERLAPAAIWAAWGADVSRRDYFVRAAQALLAERTLANAWWRFGPPTSAGHPRHPSRLRYAWSLVPFDPREYLGVLLGNAIRVTAAPLATGGHAPRRAQRDAVLP